MRKTLNQPMGIPISSTKCGSKGSWRPGKSPAVGNERSYTAARKQNTDDDIKVCFSISILVSRDLLYLFLAIIPDLPLFFFFWIFPFSPELLLSMGQKMRTFELNFSGFVVSCARGVYRELWGLSPMQSYLLIKYGFSLFVLLCFAFLRTWGLDGRKLIFLLSLGFPSLV